MQVKREKMATNECTTGAPTIVVQKQVKLPNFKVHD